MWVIAELVVDCAALRHNLSVLKARTRAKMCVMVKADAYGHGIGAVRAMSDKADSFGVASNVEALKLIKEGIKKPILVAGGFLLENLNACIENDVAVTVYSKGALLDVDRLAASMNKRTCVHLKIDSGMHRLGVKPDELSVYAELIASLKAVKLEGIFTHFATADEDVDFLEVQNEAFLQAVSKAKVCGICNNSACGAGERRTDCAVCCHAANSAALFRGKKYHYDMVRCGIAAYGYEPYCGACCGLSPAMSLRAEIVDIKNVANGETVGYSRNYTAKSDLIMGVIAIGYGDGVPRSLSNCGKVVINGHLCDIIGNICMDLLMADITACAGNVKVGDYAYVISKDGNDAGKVAGYINTIPYEVIAGITERPKRIYQDYYV